MAFIRTDFSPVGAQARAGVVPQLFAYTTLDALAAVIAAAYFPFGAGSQPNSMLGTFKTNDMIMVTYDTGGTPLTAIIFILNDGSDGNDITVRADQILSA